ncbi:M23 family metallopeptidase [uncultured Sphingomonas sp.]|uniref:M23 family metallopeptidase n=1 Tax=uncultured Sphingomonas sp. TaxID=158754 RepID=UPI0025D824B0|nr:M23 family metallopeptidase [uncultured Sphingomonas sp.]
MIARRRFAAGMLALPLIPRAAHAGGDPFALAGSFEQGGIARGQVPPGTTALRLNGQPIDFAVDGRFLIAFDRDAGASAVVEAVLADGQVVRDALAIAPRSWNISRLDHLPKIPLPSAEFAARRPAELARITAARAKQTGAQGWRQAFAWPARGRISTLFGSQRIYAGEPGAYHSGIDIALPTGTPVAAPADGVVILAAEAPFTLEGNLLMLDHGMGLSSAFLHLSRIDVREGETVRQGQAVGAVGATGRATGPHLHWGISWRGARLDPLLVAGPMGAR